MEHSRTARDFAERMGWVTGTVYVNLRRTRTKLAAGRALDATDMPLGTRTPAGLRWGDIELDRFVSARRGSRRRGGRPRRPPVTPAASPGPAAGRVQPQPRGDLNGAT